MLTEAIDVTNVQMYLPVIWPIERDAVAKLELGDALNGVCASSISFSRDGSTPSSRK